MKTITVYTVAATRQEAERVLVGKKWHRFGGRTLTTEGAAHLFLDDLRKDQPQTRVRIFPVRLTIDVEEALP